MDCESSWIFFWRYVMLYVSEHDMNEVRNRLSLERGIRRTIICRRWFGSGLRVVRVTCVDMNIRGRHHELISSSEIEDMTKKLRDEGHQDGERRKKLWLEWSENSRRFRKRSWTLFEIVENFIIRVRSTSKWYFFDISLQNYGDVSHFLSRFLSLQIDKFWIWPITLS